MQFAMILFWLLMIIWLILGPDWKAGWPAVGGRLLEWVLFALLGFAVFGQPFK